MMKVTRKVKQTLSVLLAAAMMVTAVPNNALTVFAEETVEAVGGTASEGAEEREVLEKDKEDTTSSDEEKNTDSETEDVTEEKEKEENAETDEEEEAEEAEKTETDEEEESEAEKETEDGEEPKEDELDDSDSENKEIESETELNTVTMSTGLMSADSNIASGTYGDITWVIDSDGKLTVEGTGEVEYWRWTNYCSDIKTAVINITGATKAQGMFMDCSNLISVDLSKFDTANVEDMHMMFEGCSSLSSVSLSGLNTSKVTDMSYMFKDCGNLTSVNLSGLDTSKVTDMSYMFGNCSNLPSVKLSGLDTSQVENMYGMFYGCSKLTSIDLSGLNTSLLTDMSLMFEGCSILNSVNLSGLDTGNVTSMHRMFSDCSQLSGVSLSGLNISKVTDMSSMFSDCENLTDVNLSVLNASQVEDMSNMFSGCNSLAKLNLSSFTTCPLKKMRLMFDNCSNLTSIDLSGFDTSQVTNMESVFNNCSKLINLNLNGLNTAQVTDMSWMFGNCSSLTSIDLSSFDTGKVTDMWSMFQGCSSLISVDMSGLNTSQVKDMSQMFYGCTSLSSVELSKMDIKQVTHISYMFSDCSNLTSLNLSSIDMSKVEEADNVLAGCTSLETINSPYNVSKHIVLPTAKSDDVWYQGKTIVKVLPKTLNYSVVLTKNRTSVEAEPYIKVAKTKTDYECGDTINLDDLTVTYYDKNGVATKLTEGYTTNVAKIDMSTPGKKELVVTYQKLSAKVELTVIGLLQADKVTLTLPVVSCIYSGQQRKPVPEVKLIGNGTKLTADKDYKVTYENNINVGTEAKVIITGQNGYSGIMEQTFTIRPAQVTITALDMFLQTNSEIPAQGDYKYRITGLCGDDPLLTEPTLTCEVSDMSKTGTYSIIPSGADAGSNYTISYREGTLTVAEEQVVYTVTFDIRGHGTDIQPLTGIKAGSLIDEPAAPSAEGFTFGGWYTDSACTKAWNFATDTVQENLTLYACWLSKTAGEGDLSLRIQEIPDQTYTGSALKPAVRVCGADGTLLKAGKDYTIKYYNNTDADTAEERTLGGVNSTGTEGENKFTKNMAYVVITGKGNYKGTVYSNFHILPASIGEGENAAAGITLKYTDQLTVNAGKAQKPFSSLKYKKALKAGTDFSITLTAVSAFGADGMALEAGEVVDTGSAPAIPAGYCGTFKMQINGMNNYTGTISRTIYVADKNHLLKNASISLGKNQKKIAYREGEEITLAPGYYDAVTKKYYKAFEDGEVADIPEDNGNDLFTVKFGKTYLKYGKDYVIEYANNQAVGTATMTIIGKGDYSGSKSVNFTIAGTVFNTKNVVVGDDFQASKAYTGKPLTQNRVTLTTKSGESLTYGVHYTIRYKNNIKKGTATMQFVAKPESGYTGSFNKTFKITAPELKEAAQLKLIGAQEGDKLEGTDGIYTLKADIPYSREGAKPVDRVSLVSSATGAQLKEGTDYTVSYTNNKAVTTSETAANKKPVMTIKGKGNYAGSLKVTFSISEAAFAENDRLTVTTTPTAFNLGKKDDYEYRPKIKVTDGKQTLKENKDYTVKYQNCKQTEVSAYLEALVQGSKTAEQLEQLEQMRPKAVITSLVGSGYKAGTQTTGLEIYQKKMSTTCLYVVVSQEGTTYTGAQLKPEVTVYYGSSKAVSAAKKAKETDEEVLTGESATYQLMKLKPDTDGTGDYHVSYGSNVAAGKSKGAVTVTGTGLYGGSVTTKFDIISRDVY